MKNKVKVWVLLAILGAAGSVVADIGPEYQYTQLSGLLPDTLYASQSPFKVVADIYAHDTHYVQAGVEIYFYSQTELSLSSANCFICDGTETNPMRESYH